MPIIGLETSHSSPLDHQITISSMIKFHLKWWMNTNQFVQGMPIHPPDHKTFLYTDASHYGWGAHLELMSLSFHGRWLEDQSQLHINMLEIMAIRFTLIKALKYIRHSFHNFYQQHNSGLIYEQFLPTTQQWSHISTSEEEHILPTYA